jgi:hypothetical protein
MEHVSTPPQNSNFIKSLIRIAHPDWTPEQIEAEALKKLSEISNASPEEGCEFCSS